MSDFKKSVIEAVLRVPKGKVVSYGQVAAFIGSPRAARQVGGVLMRLPEDSGVPWWRVINNAGVISIKGNWIATKEVQRELLVKEGVDVSEDFLVEIEKYRYRY